VASSSASPAILVMDEPTGNLDARNSQNILELIHDLQVRTGTTFVIATHDPTVAASAQRVIRIADGRVVADGTPEQVGISMLDGEQLSGASGAVEEPVHEQIQQVQVQQAQL